jgi:hypothetical protein
MSFYGLMEDAHAAIHKVELSNDIGHSKGGASSPIHAGSDTPGGAAMHAKPSGETQHVGRLRAGIKSPKTATDTLRRKYAASGS